MKVVKKLAGFIKCCGLRVSCCGFKNFLNPEKGFTLLELLVSIAILSMVLVMIYGTLSMGSRAWEGER
ncbi:MAG: prepilin-type N-terminal cleavage/methylation domain-containing protein [Deltaproteobacteria bacterium]|nr:prepilin-type N-terminal cleavage/methylation domain-containing protein [Deltaproteobacteria bacterium]